MKRSFGAFLNPVGRPTALFGTTCMQGAPFTTSPLVLVTPSGSHAFALPGRIAQGFRDAPSG